MILTYELQEKNSARVYYEVTEFLADELQKKMKILDKHISLFQNYICEQNLESVRDKVEYEIELVYLAVVYRWIHRVSGKHTYLLSEISYTGLQEIISRMEKTGEFKEEVQRSFNWMEFFCGYDDRKWADLWGKIEKIIEMVDYSGKKYLKKYLPKVDIFLETRARAWDEREDAGLILRDKSCYYINMIGAQILNECGCNIHWDEQGIVTSLDEEELEHVLKS